MNVSAKALCFPSSFANFAKSLWLFTADDLLSILLPNVVSSLAIALAGAPFGFYIPQIEVLTRTPLIVLWTWSNLLLFNVSNQIHDDSIDEDCENKPWRPLPSRTITRKCARILYISLWPLVLMVSTVTGGIWPTISLQIHTFAYNELKLGDCWQFRNIINAGGYLSFIIGALQVALNTSRLVYSKSSLCWLGVIAFAITTGIHSMDLYDQPGDTKRGRLTIPIIFGDTFSRRSIQLSLALVSLSVARLIGVTLASSVPSMALAVLISWRLTSKANPTVKDDKITFKLWCLWTFTLYLTPVLDKVIFSGQRWQIEV